MCDKWIYDRSTNKEIVYMVIEYHDIVWYYQWMLWYYMSIVTQSTNYIKTRGNMCSGKIKNGTLYVYLCRLTEGNNDGQFERTLKRKVCDHIPFYLILGHQCIIS